MPELNFFGSLLELQKLKKDGVSVAQRSKRDQITADTEVYVADTVGRSTIGPIFSSGRALRC